MYESMTFIHSKIRNDINFIEKTKQNITRAFFCVGYGYQQNKSLKKTNINDGKGNKTEVVVQLNSITLNYISLLFLFRFLLLNQSVFII